MKDSPNHIWVKTLKSTHKVPVDSILFIQSLNKKVSIHLADEENLNVYTAISDMEKKLACGKFYRCHRSYLVNIDHVTDFVEKVPEVILSNNSRIPVAKRRKGIFLKMLFSD